MVLQKTDHWTSQCREDRAIVLRLAGVTAEALILIAVDSCMRQRHLAIATTRGGSIVPNHET